jgi:hypothetical protein
MQTNKHCFGVSEFFSFGVLKDPFYFYLYGRDLPK